MGDTRRERHPEIFKVVPDTHNLLVPDTQITHCRGTEALNRPANITIDNNSNPAIPEIIIKNKNIKDVDMPLSFIFCLRNRNVTSANEKYKEAGYESIYRFFSGTSMYNESIVGWLGQMENGSTYDSFEGTFYISCIRIKYRKLIMSDYILEVLAKLKLEDVYLRTVKRIRFESSDNDEIVHNLEASFGRNSPLLQPNCRLLESKITSVPMRIKIELWKTENVTFHMNIVEKNMALAKRCQNSFAYNGPFLGLDNLREASHVAIGLRVKQSHYSDQDEETNCVNYPTKKFKSYRECDEDFTIEEMQKIGVMPFWATKGNITTSK